MCGVVLTAQNADDRVTHSKSHVEVESTPLSLFAQNQFTFVILICSLGREGGAGPPRLSSALVGI